MPAKGTEVTALEHNYTAAPCAIAQKRCPAAGRRAGRTCGCASTWTVRRGAVAPWQRHVLAHRARTRGPLRAARRPRAAERALATLATVPLRGRRGMRPSAQRGVQRGRPLCVHSNARGWRCRTMQCNSPQLELATSLRAILVHQVPTTRIKISDPVTVHYMYLKWRICALQVQAYFLRMSFTLHQVQGTRRRASSPEGRGVVGLKVVNCKKKTNGTFSAGRQKKSLLIGIEPMTLRLTAARSAN